MRNVLLVTAFAVLILAPRVAGAAVALAPSPPGATMQFEPCFQTGEQRSAVITVIRRALRDPETGQDPDVRSSCSDVTVGLIEPDTDLLSNRPRRRKAATTIIRNDPPNVPDVHRRVGHHAGCDVQLCGPAPAPPWRSCRAGSPWSMKRLDGVDAEIGPFRVIL